MIDVDTPAVPPHSAKRQELSSDQSTLNKHPKTHRRKKTENTAGMKQLNVESVRMGDGESDSDHVSPRSDGVVFDIAGENDESNQQKYR